MVLDRGVIAEFDTPYNLLQNPAGYFAKLVKEQGQQFESKMLNLAAQKQREVE